MSASAAAGRSKRSTAWTAGAALLAICGVLGSVLVAISVGTTDEQKSRKALENSADAIASTLQLAIQHEEDLLVSARGFWAGNPQATQAQFVQWANAVQALQRYPELDGLGFAVVVPAADLADFAAQALRDPTGPLSPAGTYHVTPAGNRAFYCLATTALARDGKNLAPAGLDYCTIPSAGPAAIEARDSGAGSYQPVHFGDQTLLVIEMPVYSGGVTPATQQARQAAFIGWTGMTMAPDALLDRALRGHTDIAVSMRYQAGASDVVFSRGTAPTDPHAVALDLKNGWTITTSGAITGAGVLGNGNALAWLIIGVALSTALGLLVFVLATGRERARRQVEQRTGQLHHQALHDVLTGLPNRALVLDRIEQMLVRDRRNHTTGAALFLDLDDFKNINDTLGHGAGDRLLIAVAGRLRNTLRGIDTIGRMGGDEFVVLIDGASVDVAPELVAERLLDVMRQPFELDDVSMPLTVNLSIGIASGDRTNAGELLRDADIAVYQAKGNGKNRYEVFDPQMQTSISRRTELEFDLRSALSRNEYRLVYLPVYNLDDLAVVGVEALLRWDHPTRGLISPDEFIPILEQTGHIDDVGRWVLQHACQQMATWHARGDTLDISVNVSARQLDNDTLTDDIVDALQTSGLPAASLIIEITETALMHNVEATARRLHAVKKLGIRIAVDDFGTGYSSLAYLRQFPVDSLKIDRVFVNALTASPESKALVGTLVQLGKDLGLSTLAEGVETTEEMDLLRGANVNHVQGFLMAHPLDPGSLEAQLLKPTRVTTSATTTPAKGIDPTARHPPRDLL